MTTASFSAPGPRPAPWALIVGAGPAGLVAANLLGKLGVPTLLIEKNAGLSGQPKALMVDDEFFRLLNSLGLADALRGHGVGPVTFEVYSPFGFRVATIAGRITEHHFPTRTATFQPVFERILFNGITRWPNVEVKFGHELIGFEDRTEGVRVSIKNPQGLVETLDVQYVLAADGARSSVRKLLNIEFDELMKFGQRQIVIDVANDPNRSTIAITRLGLRRNYTSLPTPDGGRRYEFSLRPGEDETVMLGKSTLARLFKRQKLDYPGMQVIRQVVYTFHSRLARNLSRGRVFLLGDAAHIMPVFGSQGMNSGARDANNLCWKLAAVHAGRAGASILRSYHTERHPHVADTIRIATANGKLQSVRRLPVTLLRDLLLGALSFIPALRRYVAEMRYIPKPYLRSGIVIRTGNAEADATDTLTGRVLPLPEVIHEGRAQLLDDILGLNFALIALAPQAGALPTGLSAPQWRRIGTTVIALSPKDVPVEAAGLLIASTTDDRLQTILSQQAGKWLLVRPDRVIAAVMTPDQIGRAASQLETMLDAMPASLPLAA